MNWAALIKVGSGPFEWLYFQTDDNPLDHLVDFGDIKVFVLYELPETESWPVNPRPHGSG